VMSNEEEERTSPVTPSIEDMKMKPTTHKREGLLETQSSKREESHVNTLTPVGTAITIVAHVKYARVSMSIPTVNMW
jgi:hypothetical protein